MSYISSRATLGRSAANACKLYLPIDQALHTSCSDDTAVWILHIVLFVLSNAYIDHSADIATGFCCLSSKQATKLCVATQKPACKSARRAAQSTAGNGVASTWNPLDIEFNLQLTTRWCGSWGYRC